MRYSHFFKQLVDKYFAGTATKSKVIICVSHGVPCHNGLLQLFEPDKELVYLDQGALTIIEKIGYSPFAVEKKSKEKSTSELEETYLN